MAPLFWDIPILWWPQYHPGRKDALALHWILTMTRNGWILHQTVGLRYPSILCSTPNEEEGAHLHQYVRHGCLWNLLVINPRFDNLFGRFSFVPTSPKFWEREYSQLIFRPYPINSTIVPAAQVAWIDSQNQSFTFGIPEGVHRGWKYHGGKSSHSTSHSGIPRHILDIRTTKGVVVWISPTNSSCVHTPTVLSKTHSYARLWRWQPKAHMAIFR